MRIARAQQERIAKHNAPLIKRVCKKKARKHDLHNGSRK
jgi:hypothetical protein